MNARHCLTLRSDNLPESGKRQYENERRARISRRRPRKYKVLRDMREKNREQLAPSFFRRTEYCAMRSNALQHRAPIRFASVAGKCIDRRVSLGRDDFSSIRHLALSFCLSMIFFGKPVPTFPDHALASANSTYSVESKSSSFAFNIPDSVRRPESSCSTAGAAKASLMAFGAWPGLTAKVLEGVRAMSRRAAAATNVCDRQCDGNVSHR